PLAEGPEVVRRLEQPEQRGRLLHGVGLRVEVVAREVGEAELVLRCELPGEVEIDVAGERLRAGDQLGRRRLVELEQHVGRLHLDALAGVELDLHRAFRLRHHPTGQELAAFLEQCIHPPNCRSRAFGQMWQSVRMPRQKWMPRIICCIAIASGDSTGLALLSPFAAALSGNMRKVVFITICATRGSSACSTSPDTPSRVAMRTGLATQACAIMSAASSGARVGTLL